MRTEVRNALARFAPLTVLPALAAFLLLAAACQDSQTVTAPPAAGMTAAAAPVAGIWTGTFESDDSARCGSSSATATFQQNGNEVTGTISTSTCGVTGYFKGTIQGNALQGAVEMAGCTGGGASGIVTASGISLTIGDLTKPILTADKVVMAGGIVSLRR